MSTRVRKVNAVIQSIVIPRDVAASVSQAKRMAIQAGGRADNPQHTDGAYRFRQAQPGRMDAETFETKTLASGVRIVTAKPKRSR